MIARGFRKSLLTVAMINIIFRAPSESQAHCQAFACNQQNKLLRVALVTEKVQEYLVTYTKQRQQVPVQTRRRARWHAPVSPVIQKGGEAGEFS